VYCALVSSSWKDDDDDDEDGDDDDVGKRYKGRIKQEWGEKKEEKKGTNKSLRWTMIWWRRRDEYTTER